jgi:hypothetical protein
MKHVFEERKYLLLTYTNTPLRWFFPLCSLVGTLFSLNLTTQHHMIPQASPEQTKSSSHHFPRMGLEQRYTVLPFLLIVVIVPGTKCLYYPKSSSGVNKQIYFEFIGLILLI